MEQEEFKREIGKEYKTPFEADSSKEPIIYNRLSSQESEAGSFMARAISVRERAEKSTDIGERDKAYGEAIEFYRRAKLLYLEANEQFKKSQNTEDIIQALKNYSLKIYDKAIRVGKWGVDFFKNNDGIKTLDEFLKRESEKYGSKEVRLSVIRRGWRDAFSVGQVENYQARIYVKSKDNKRKIKVLKYNGGAVFEYKFNEIETKLKKDILEKVDEKAFTIQEEPPRFPKFPVRAFDVTKECTKLLAGVLIVTLTFPIWMWYVK